VLVNYQVVGGAHEGQPGFTLVLLKGGFAPPVGPISRMHLEPEQLSEVLSAVATPTAPLALEATADPHFDVLFDDSAATSHRGEFASKGAAQ
jgi:hypothetical protein